MIDPAAPPDADARKPASAEVVRALADNHREFLRFLERRVGDKALAEDILQDAFVRGIDKIGSLRDGESAVAWFYRALRNAVIDVHRRRQASARALASFADELAGAEPPTETREAVCQCVARLAGTLKPEYAEALEHIEVKGEAVKAFAEARGLSSNNAAVRVFRAREALRKQVMASCGTCAEHGCIDCTCSHEAAAAAPAAVEPGSHHEGHGCCGHPEETNDPA